MYGKFNCVRQFLILSCAEVKAAKAISVLSFYAVSIFGYCTMYFLHELAHSVDNPFHRHAVEKQHHAFKAHGFEDHGASKFLAEVQAESDYQQAMKVVKVLYFFSFYAPTMIVEHQSSFDWIKNAFISSVPILEMDFTPPSPPPDVV